MRTSFFLLSFLLFAVSSFGASIPVRWLEGPRGYQQAQEIQKQTQASILVWATWHECPNCAAVTRYLSSSKVKNTLKDSIRVVIDEHGPAKEADFAKAKGFRGGNFYIISPASEKPVSTLWAWKSGDDDSPRLMIDDLAGVLASKTP